MTIKTSKSGADFPGCIVLEHGLKSFRLLQLYVQRPPLDLKSRKAEHQSPWSSELLSCSLSPKALHKMNGLLSSHHSWEAISRSQVHSQAITIQALCKKVKKQSVLGHLQPSLSWQLKTKTSGNRDKTLVSCLFKISNSQNN